MTEYRVPFIFSSDSETGAINISNDGSSFEVELETPLIIPKTAKTCYVSVDRSTIWWNIFNIKAGINDQFKISYDDGINPLVTETLTINSGLYDIEHLNAAILFEIANVGTLPIDIIVLLPDTATQKSVFQFNYTGVQIDFTIANTFREILGFDSRLVPLAPSTITLQYEYSDNIASFNQIEYFLIHSDLVSRGIRINNSYNQTIEQVLIDVPPSSQIISTPFHPIFVPAPELIGETRKLLRFWLTDDKNNLVDTNNEIFSLRLVIHYIV